MPKINSATASTTATSVPKNHMKTNLQNKPMRKLQLTILSAAISCSPILNNALAVRVQWTIGPGANGHFYEIAQASGTNVPVYGGLSWTEARSLAIGAGGYLATITSAGENSFIAGLLESSAADRGWLGGSDSATEGTFKWIDGPEAGTNFSFTSWNGGEPNNNTQTYIASGGPANPEGEDFAEMYSSRVNNASGKWNDLPNNGTPGIAYVVEYDVPEPSTLALGFFGALALLRRRQRNPALEPQDNTGNT